MNATQNSNTFLIIKSKISLYNVIIVISASLGIAKEKLRECRKQYI